MKKTVVAATVLSSLIAFHSTACELHAGMGNMQFGFQHPMMQQHLAAAKEPLISLNIDRKREVAKLETFVDSTFIISYQEPYMGLGRMKISVPTRGISASTLADSWVTPPTSSILSPICMIIV